MVKTVSEEFDPGFDIFFKTNLEEMDNFPIYFDKPLPTWLKGTLVSSILFTF